MTGKQAKTKEPSYVAAGLLWIFLPLSTMAASDLSRGEAAFEERRWPAAMEAFLDVLRSDPTNTEAHAYINLIAREMESERQAIVRAHRLQMLDDASRQLELSRQNAAPLQQAILAASESEKNAQAAQWQARCEEGRMERQAGHLEAANDLILQVLAENNSFGEAQRELSEIQTALHRSIENGEGISVVERFALEGFYAYNDADYDAAAKTWGKLRTLLEQSYPGAEGERQAKDLRFPPYEKIAQDHVNETRRLADLKTLFDNGLGLFQQKHFTRSLEAFRKVAIRDPEYPQLGYYLVQAEAASERERAERLGEEKRREIDRAFESGVAAMEKENLSEAQADFERVLKLEPSHPQARSYLAMVRAEAEKRHDPRAAQMHYEAGLIAYASGKLDEAMREWQAAIRMNPDHEKAHNAMAKVQRELALNKKELTNETLP
ncbi:MAG TPA: tetratricopeptide repeat protein [Elusimicrobiota bacterium]|nr:tetratricopeptide repeat protein [Elusimicrobiota bacterium]